MTATAALKILTIDDTPSNLRFLAAVFEAEGLIVATAEGGQEGIDKATADPPDIVLCDLRMPGMDGLETLVRLKIAAPQIPVVMLTSHGDVATAVEAIKRGAEDFLIRPIQSDRLVLTVRRALERRELKVEVESLRRLVDRQGHLARLITPSPLMRGLVESIRQVAGSNFTVLIHGETGTGKELVARAIHQESSRSAKPFIAVDSGAIPDTLFESELFGYEKGAFSGADRRKEGYFQMAESGTLFLDEVSNLPVASQPKLLRAIQEHQIRPVGGVRTQNADVRIIAATNDSLVEQINKGLFRQDLYFRLAEYAIALPPLRERREDILALARCFLEEASVELKRPASVIADSAAAMLQEYNWPGNIRQLRNVMRRAALQGTGVALVAGDIEAMLLDDGQSVEMAAAAAPQAVAATPAGNAAVHKIDGMSLRDVARLAQEEAEKLAIIEALRATRGHKQKAAQLLKTDYKTLFVKLKRYGLGNGGQLGDAG
jgi:DNA-binding NtrC family response regulator